MLWGNCAVWLAAVILEQKEKEMKLQKRKNYSADVNIRGLEPNYITTHIQAFQLSSEAYYCQIK